MLQSLSESTDRPQRLSLCSENCCSRGKTKVDKVEGYTRRVPNHRRVMLKVPVCVVCHGDEVLDDPISQLCFLYRSVMLVPHVALGLFNPSKPLPHIACF